MKTRYVVLFLSIVCAGCSFLNDTSEPVRTPPQPAVQAEQPQEPPAQAVRIPVQKNNPDKPVLIDDNDAAREEIRQQQLDMLEERLDEIVDEYMEKEEALDRDVILERLRLELPPGMNEVPEETIEELDWWLA